MDSAAKESILPDRLSERLGGLILKEEQKLAIEALMSGKDVLAVLPTGFGKSVIYQSFVLAIKDSSSIVVIVPLRSIIDDQLQSNDFGLKAVAFDKKPELMKDIAANKFQVIFASAEQALSKEFRDLLKDESSEFRKNLSLVVVDECHTIEIW
ncbi:probable ATP-dependent DNA helicase RecS [Montipora foliosa]|uniref:probable ATP-dependent DNA helicase RecS n=1 Tax=Montipora foliosa TaxID=591990 RepID=UPI0035F1B67C